MYSQYIHAVCSGIVCGSIVYNLAIVYKRPEFFMVVVRVIIIDHWNQPSCLYKIQVTIIYSHAILVAVMSEVIRKTWTGKLANSADPDQMPQNAVSDQVLHCLLKLQEVKS